MKNGRVVWMLPLIIFTSIVFENRISDKVLPCFWFLSLYCPGIGVLWLLSFCSGVENGIVVWMLLLILFYSIHDNRISDRVIPCFLFFFQSFTLELAYIGFLASVLVLKNGRVVWMLPLFIFTSIVYHNRISDRVLPCFLFLSIYYP